MVGPLPPRGDKRPGWLQQLRDQAQPLLEPSCTCGRGSKFQSWQLSDHWHGLQDRVLLSRTRPRPGCIRPGVSGLRRLPRRRSREQSYLRLRCVSSPRSCSGTDLDQETPRGWALHAGSLKAWCPASYLPSEGWPPTLRAGAEAQHAVVSLLRGIGGGNPPSVPERSHRRMWQAQIRHREGNEGHTPSLAVAIDW